MEKIFLGFGSNLGHRFRNFVKILKWLDASEDFYKIGTSSIYLSEPVGVKHQPFFLNAVIRCTTRLSPLNLLDRMKEMESKAGRIPGKRWGAREADLDILLYGNDICRFDNLLIPHPEMLGRLFVMEPLSELDPVGSHPVSGENFYETAVRLSQIEGRPGLEKVIDRPALKINRNIGNSLESGGNGAKTELSRR